MQQVEPPAEDRVDLVADALAVDLTREWAHAPQREMTSTGDVNGENGIDLTQLMGRSKLDTNKNSGLAQFDQLRQLLIQLNATSFVGEFHQRPPRTTARSRQPVDKVEASST